MGIVSDSSVCRLLPEPLSWWNRVESTAWSHLAQARALASGLFICYCICGDPRIRTNSLLAIPLLSTCLCLWLATASWQSRAHICVSGLALITSWVPHTNACVRRLLACGLSPCSGVLDSTVRSLVNKPFVCISHHVAWSVELPSATPGHYHNPSDSRLTTRPVC
jgi:hypothetical protein